MRLHSTPCSPHENKSPTSTQVSYRQVQRWSGSRQSKASLYQTTPSDLPRGRASRHGYSCMAKDQFGDACTTIANRMAPGVRDGQQIESGRIVPVETPALSQCGRLRGRGRCLMGRSPNTTAPRVAMRWRRSGNRPTPVHGHPRVSTARRTMNVHGRTKPTAGSRGMASTSWYSSRCVRRLRSSTVAGEANRSEGWVDQFTAGLMSLRAWPYDRRRSCCGPRRLKATSVAMAPDPSFLGGRVERGASQKRPIEANRGEP